MLIGTSAPAALTIAEMCSTYRICKTKVYAEINARRLHAVKVGARTLIPSDSAAQWFASLPAINVKPAA